MFFRQRVEQLIMAAENKVEAQVEVLNQLGLHARPATMLARTAMEFSSELVLERDGDTVNPRSLMGILMLAAGKGTRLTVRAIGEDAARAVAALVELFESKFGED